MFEEIQQEFVRAPLDPEARGTWGVETGEYTMGSGESPGIGVVCGITTLETMASWDPMLVIRA